MGSLISGSPDRLLDDNCRDNDMVVEWQTDHETDVDYDVIDISHLQG